MRTAAFGVGLAAAICLLAGGCPVEQQPPAVNLSMEGDPISEAAGTATVTAGLDAPAEQDVTVDLAFAGTAERDVDYTAEATQIVIAAGQTSAAVVLTAIEDGADEEDETIVVSIESVTGAVAGSVSQVETTLQDNDGPGSVSMALAGSQILEDGGVATVTVALPGTLPQDVIVTLTVGGTATPGEDYTMTATRLVIPAGFLSAAATLTPVEDEVLEPDETVIIDIDEVVNGTESGVQQVTVTILNDDTLPTLTINDATVTEGEAGPLQAVFTITLSAFSLVPVTVDYATVDGTAAAGSDYTARSGTLTYVPGQRVKEVRVPVADDALDEASEGFTLELSNATEAAIDDAVGAGTIHDDDPPPAVTLQVNDPTLTESQVPMATLTARLSAVSGRDVTVGVNFGGTATLGADYTRTDDRIVIPAGQISGALRFGAVQDDAAEGEETIVLTIGSLVNAVEEAPQEVTVTIADDDGP